jgi:putative membrane protein
MMHGFGGYGWGMGFGWVFMLLFWAAIIYFIYTLMRRSARDHSDSASEILKKRYAGGEISKEEFERMKKELQT